MPVTYVRLTKVDDEVHAEEMLRWEELWREDEREDGLPSMPRSSPIRIWALLRPGKPLEAAELARQAGVTRKRLGKAMCSLRRRGQRVVYDRRARTYQYFPSPPLRVVEGTRGLRLALEDGGPPGKGEVLHELG